MQRSSLSPDLGCRFKHALRLSVEVLKSSELAYSEAKLELQGRWRIWMEVRRAEEEEGDDGGLRLREQEGKKKEKKRGKRDI